MLRVPSLLKVRLIVKMSQQRFPPVVKRTQTAEAVDCKRKLSRNKYNSKCLGSNGDIPGVDAVTLNSEFLTFEKPFFDGENTASSANKKMAKEPQTLTTLAPAAVSKKFASTTHRKKRQENTELALEDGGEKKPRSSPMWEHGTSSSDDINNDTAAQSLTESHVKLVTPQDSILKTIKKSLAWPLHNSAKSCPPPLQGCLPPLKIALSRSSGSALSAKAPSLKGRTPPLRLPA